MRLVDMPLIPPPTSLAPLPFTLRETPFLLLSSLFFCILVILSYAFTRQVLPYLRGPFVLFVEAKVPRRCAGEGNDSDLGRHLSAPNPSLPHSGVLVLFAVGWIAALIRAANHEENSGW